MDRVSASNQCKHDNPDYLCSLCKIDRLTAEVENVIKDCADLTEENQRLRDAMQEALKLLVAGSLPYAVIYSALEGEGE